MILYLNWITGENFQTTDYTQTCWISTKFEGIKCYKMKSLRNFQYYNLEFLENLSDNHPWKAVSLCYGAFCEVAKSSWNVFVRLPLNQINNTC